MNRTNQILLTEGFVKKNLKGYDSGHDWWHIERVRGIAKYINSIENLADPFIVEITALLHDTADSKFANGNSEQGYLMIGDFMERSGMTDMIQRVLDVIKRVSFSSKKNSDSQDDPLLWVIQDADRLDAIGAIGIARAFNYGGFRNNKIYNPSFNRSKEVLDNNSLKETESTIGHFYEKLLLLKDMMNTQTGKKLAIERHKFLEIFLKQFYKEWKFAASLNQQIR
jgi:uncharacterized protein